MKKTLFTIMAIAALAASCNKAEVIDANRQAIAFGAPFVDNATKADYSEGKTLKAFQVWGTVTGKGNTVNVFNGADVTGKVGDEVWDCTQTEYWVPSCSYAFTAIADATSVTPGANDMPAAINYTVAADQDLLLATKSAATSADGTPSENPVKFTFGHLLSKVFFTFKYGVDDNTKYAFKVTGISISDLTEKGVYTISSSEWKADAEASVTTLNFGEGTVNVANGVNATSTVSHQILPLTETAQISVTYDIIYDGKTIMTGETQTAKLTDQSFVQNTVYNINITLPAPGAPIQFSVESVGAFGETPEQLLQ